MVLLKLRRRLILGISLVELLFLGLDNLAIASWRTLVTATPKFNHHNTIPLMASSEARDLEQKSRLDQSLEMIDEMDESQLKVILLNDLALNYAKLGYEEKAIAILEQSLSIAESFEDVVVKVTTMTSIAKYYAQIGQKPRSIEILDNTVALASQVADKSLQGQLLLEISLKYGEIGEEASAQTLFAQSQTIIAEASQPLPEFPFPETPPTVKLGFSGSVNSFRDTTALVGIDVDFAKQWSYDDIFVDGSIYIDYDSSRSVNNYRPGSLILSVYRNHFNEQWNFFTNFFNSTNQDLFAAKNDDEDITIISEVLVGAGLNLWRGDSPSNFLDFQLGIGPRYEYDYIDFELRRNQVDPTLGIILLGRGLPIGEAKLNQVFGIFPTLNDLNNYNITSNTKLSVPLTERWSLSNRLFVRYRNELVFESNPKWELFFTTGLEYEF